MLTNIELYTEEELRIIQKQLEIGISKCKNTIFLAEQDMKFFEAELGPVKRLLEKMMSDKVIQENGMEE